MAAVSRADTSMRMLKRMKYLHNFFIIYDGRVASVAGLNPDALGLFTAIMN